MKKTARTTTFQVIELEDHVLQTATGAAEAVDVIGLDVGCLDIGCLDIGCLDIGCLDIGCLDIGCTDF